MRKFAVPHLFPPTALIAKYREENHWDFEMTITDPIAITDPNPQRLWPGTTRDCPFAKMKLPA